MVKDWCFKYFFLLRHIVGYKTGVLNDTYSLQAADVVYFKTKTRHFVAVNLVNYHIRVYT